MRQRPSEAASGLLCVPPAGGELERKKKRALQLYPKVPDVVCIFAAELVQAEAACMSFDSWGLLCLILLTVSAGELDVN